MEVKVVQNVMKANDSVAEDNRKFLEAHHLAAFNVMASPGAGKTTLLMATIDRLKDRVRLGAIEGDTASQVDADKVSTTGVPVVQINTGGGCHLDAPMVREALEALPLDELDAVIIENVGNLVCPAAFALGETVNVVILSVPEGDDKPYKYPGMFVRADVVVISKIDLLPYLDFDVEAFKKLVLSVNPKVEFFELSCKTGEGVDAWCDWVADFTAKAKAESEA